MNPKRSDLHPSLTQILAAAPVLSPDGNSALLKRNVQPKAAVVDNVMHVNFLRYVADGKKFVWVKMRCNKMLNSDISDMMRSLWVFHTVVVRPRRLDSP